MSGIIFTVVALVIGVMIFGAGVYYLLKEKEDAESRKIYTITAVIGAAITIGVVIKLLIAGV